MEETSRTGIPLMRPMFLEYPADKRFETSDTEFMFGPDLLVAPKVDEKFEPYDVTLPAGTWYDFWTGRDASSTKTLNPALDVLPVFVRAGAIIPEQPVVQNTAEAPQGPLQISVYPGPDCRGSLYEDDGNTLTYRRGEFLEMQFTCQLRPDSLSLKFSATHANYKPWWNSMKVVLFGMESRPSEVVQNGNALNNWNFDPDNRNVSLTLPVSAAGETELVVTK
jgi:alpha-glucosidase